VQQNAAIALLCGQEEKTMHTYADPQGCSNRVPWLAAAMAFVSCEFVGCAATQIALEKKDLSVQTRMSETVFLDLDEEQGRTIYVDVKNTSDKDIDVESPLRQNLQAKGFTIAASPREAFYHLQANILYVGKADPSALREVLNAGYGTALAGGLGGAAIGGATHNYSGALYGGAIGMLAGGAAEVVSGALVKDVTYTIVTDLQISQATHEKVEQSVRSALKQGTASTVVQKSDSSRNRKTYQTRIMSTANKVNLGFDEAEPYLIAGLSKSIAGIF
jgi:outer membrane lipoprotein SlyB